jgi:hypothetical protein
MEAKRGRVLTELEVKRKADGMIYKSRLETDSLKRRYIFPLMEMCDQTGERGNGLFEDTSAFSLSFFAQALGTPGNFTMTVLRKDMLEKEYGCKAGIAFDAYKSAVTNGVKLALEIRKKTAVPATEAEDMFARLLELRGMDVEGFRQKNRSRHGPFSRMILREEAMFFNAPPKSRFPVEDSRSISSSEISYMIAEGGCYGI